MGRDDDIRSVVRALLDEAPDNPPGEPRSLIYEALRRDEEPDEESPPVPNIQAPEFEWKFNLGHVLQAIAMFAALGGAVWHFSQSTAEMRKELDQVVANGALYRPRVDALERSEQVQNERIQNITNGMAEIRKSSQDTQAILSVIREDLASVKARLSVERSQR